MPNGSGAIIKIVGVSTKDVASGPTVVNLVPNGTVDSARNVNGASGKIGVPVKGAGSVASGVPGGLAGVVAIVGAVAAVVVHLEHAKIV